MRLLQVGVGGFGASWTPIIMACSGVELAGVVDVNPDALALIAAQHGIPEARCYRDYDSALAHAGCDAVLLATPPVLHTPQAIAAAKARKHVLTEKPLSDTREGALAMVQACADAGVTLMVSQNYRRAAEAMSVRVALERGVIGPLAELGHVSVEFYKAYDFGAENFRTLMDYPLLIDMGIHHVDLLRYLTGADVVSVYARSFRPSWSWYRHEPGLAMTMQLSNGGAGAYLGSWVSGGRETPWSGDWRLQGPRGALLWGADGIQLAEAGSSTVQQLPVETFSSLDRPRVLEEFVQAINTGVEPMTSGRDNLRSIGIQFAALESIRRNAPVTLEELGM